MKLRAGANLFTYILMFILPFIFLTGHRGTVLSSIEGSLLTNELSNYDKFLLDYPYLFWGILAVAAFITLLYLAKAAVINELAINRYKKKVAFQIHQRAIKLGDVHDYNRQVLAKYGLSYNQIGECIEQGWVSDKIEVVDDPEGMVVDWTPLNYDVYRYITHHDPNSGDTIGFVYIQVDDLEYIKVPYEYCQV